MSNPHDFHTPQSSYTRADLLNSSEGGYFGPGNAQLPAPPMLMLDRITEISLDRGAYGKGHVIGELDIGHSSGSSTACLLAIPSCRDVWAWTPCGN